MGGVDGRVCESWDRLFGISAVFGFFEIGLAWASVVWVPLSARWYTEKDRRFINMKRNILRVRTCIQPKLHSSQSYDEQSGAPAPTSSEFRRVLYHETTTPHQDWVIYLTTVLQLVVAFTSTLGTQKLRLLLQLLLHIPRTPLCALWESEK